MGPPAANIEGLQKARLFFLERRGFWKGPEEADHDLIGGIVVTPRESYRMMEGVVAWIGLVGVKKRFQTIPNALV